MAHRRSGKFDVDAEYQMHHAELRCVDIYCNLLAQDKVNSGLL